jgi:hypothetical protein
MLINRRAFMQGAALLAVSDLMPLSWGVQAYASLRPGSLPTQMAVGGTGAQLVFKVEGWDRRDDIPVRLLKTPSIDHTNGDLDGGEVFIRVNRAWQSAWR